MTIARLRRTSIHCVACTLLAIVYLELLLEHSNSICVPQVLGKPRYAQHEGTGTLRLQYYILYIYVVSTLGPHK